MKKGGRKNGTVAILKSMHGVSLLPLLIWSTETHSSELIPMKKGGRKNGTVAILKSMHGVSSLTRHLSRGINLFEENKFYFP